MSQQNSDNLDISAYKKALFLDRDGIINEDHAYVYSKEQFDFIPDIFELTKRAKLAGYLLIVVTNQSGIARGFYTEEQFKDLTQWMIKCFAQQGVDIDDVYFCPHHPTAGDGPLTTQCDCRKPAPGMFLKASTKHHIDLSQSIMLGDKLSDMEAAMGAGIVQNYLFRPRKQTSDLANTGVGKGTFETKNTGSEQLVSQASRSKEDICKELKVKGTENKKARAENTEGKTYKVISSYKQIAL